MTKITPADRQCTDEEHARESAELHDNIMRVLDGARNTSGEIAISRAMFDLLMTTYEGGFRTREETIEAFGYMTTQIINNMKREFDMIDKAKHDSDISTKH